MNIFCGNRTLDVEAGMTVMQCLRALCADVKGVLAVQQGGRVLELTDIITREGEKSETVAEFDRVMALSKIQAGPYAYVKTWFLKKYGEEFNAEEEASEAPKLKDDEQDKYRNK